MMASKMSTSFLRSLVARTVKSKLRLVSRGTFLYTSGKHRIFTEFFSDFNRIRSASPRATVIHWGKFCKPSNCNNYHLLFLHLATEKPQQED